MRRHHDMGGAPAGPIDRHEHELAPWEKQVDAILRLLLAKRMLTLDELRRGVEELGPGAYDELSYFERWIAAIATCCWRRASSRCRSWVRRSPRPRRRHAAAATA